MAARRVSVHLSARETVELRKCALIAAATAVSGMDKFPSPQVHAEAVVLFAERFMQFLVSGDGK